MVQRIDYQGVIDAQAAGIPVVEVLEASEYRRLHIAGAINLPIKRLDREMAARLDPTQPVVVYCFDAY
jgi:rhodanese-related sulfurtransferase